MIQKKINTKWLYPLAISLLLFFLIEFIRLTRIFFSSSLFRLTDLKNNAAEIFFLFKYGLHHSIPNFYNGFIVNLLLYPPGWAFFTLPFLYFFDLTTSVYIAFILVYVLGFLGSMLVAKYARISWSKGLFFFIFFFMNPIIFDYAFYIGRFPELFAWMVYIFLLAMILKYKKSAIGFMGGILVCIILASLLLAHPYVSPFGLFLVFLLFLTKERDEKIRVVFILVFALLLSSFWLVPFFNALIHPPNIHSPTDYQRGGLLNPDSIVSFNTITICLFWFIFYFYWKGIKKVRKDKFFFYPILFLSFLVFFRASPFIPVLDQIPPNAYNLFFLSWSLILFLKTSFTPKIKKLIWVTLMLLPIFVAVFVFVIRADARIHADYTSVEQEIISFFPEIDDRYIIMNEKGLRWGWEFSYAAVYYNLSTPQGFYSSGVSQNMLDMLAKLNDNIKEKDCARLKESLKGLNVKFLLAIENCEFLRECDFDEVKEKEHVCLFRYF